MTRRADSADVATARRVGSLAVLRWCCRRRDHDGGGQPHLRPARYPDVVPAITPFIKDNSKLDEAALQRAAVANNREFLRLLRTQEDLSAKVFADLPTSIYDEVNLRDAWGTPIVFMGSYHPAVGTAPRNRYFFFSAGPDGHYLTKADNLYSYETPIPQE